MPSGKQSATFRRMRTVLNSDPGLPGFDTAHILSRIRLLLLALLAFGAVGLMVELVLLEHWEAATQLVPLVLLGASVVVAVAALLLPGRTTRRLLRITMIAAIVAGCVGAVFHYRSNAQLEVELAPDRSATEIFSAAMRGGTPTLAPGALIQLGLLGLIATFCPVPQEETRDR